MKEQIMKDVRKLVRAEIAAYMDELRKDPLADLIVTSRAANRASR
jgi:hypothetical protein